MEHINRRPNSVDSLKPAYGTMPRQDYCEAGRQQANECCENDQEHAEYLAGWQEACTQYKFYPTQSTCLYCANEVPVEEIDDHGYHCYPQDTSGFPWMQ